MSKKILLALSIICVATFAMVGPVFAQNQDGTGPVNIGQGRFGNKGNHGILGTVSSVSGSTIIVKEKVRPIKNGSAQTEKVYTVDASNATVTKNGASSSVSAIVVGDTVMVQGTINETNVVAKVIRDGLPQFDKNPGQNGRQIMFEGDGQPIVAGSVSSVNGSTITITNKSNITYTVDVSSAKITKNGSESSASNIVIGDEVVAQGAVNGTSVTASSVIDHVKINETANSSSDNKPNPGFFGGIVGFFRGLFGF